MMYGRLPHRCTSSRTFWPTAAITCHEIVRLWWTSPVRMFACDIRCKRVQVMRRSKLKWFRRGKFVLSRRPNYFISPRQI
jgi:hypothetical protein